MPNIDPFEDIENLDTNDPAEVEAIEIADEWEYEGWSITNDDTWDWNRVKARATTLI